MNLLETRVQLVVYWDQSTIWFLICSSSLNIHHKEQLQYVYGMLLHVPSGQESTFHTRLSPTCQVPHPHLHTWFVPEVILEVEIIIATIKNREDLKSMIRCEVGRVFIAAQYLIDDYGRTKRSTSLFSELLVCIKCSTFIPPWCVLK